VEVKNLLRFIELGNGPERMQDCGFDSPEARHGEIFATCKKLAAPENARLCYKREPIGYRGETKAVSKLGIGQLEAISRMKEMTLDEAIEHADEIARECGPCAEDHRQLATWLRELKERRSQMGQLETDGGEQGVAK
jgi:hypothetical protein